MVAPSNATRPMRSGERREVLWSANHPQTGENARSAAPYMAMRTETQYCTKSTLAGHSAIVMEFSITSVLIDVASCSEREWNYWNDHSVQEHILSILISVVLGSSCQENVRKYYLLHK
jgi:hypothetical protein